MKLAVLGPKGTFTELAALKYLKSEAGSEIIFANSIYKVFKLVEQGQVDEGIIPLENQLNGTVRETLDRLFETGLKIKAQIDLDIHHSLLKNPKTKKIEAIASHNQALAQCSKFINENYPDAKLINTTSTTEAMEMVANEKIKNGAAIGNKLAAKDYSLEIVAENIEDNKNNITRFAVIAKHDANGSGKKTSIAVYPKEDRPGLLYEMLGEFAKRKVNLTKIESRPTKEKLGQYIFYIDMEGDKTNQKIQEAIIEIKKIALVKILGSYSVVNNSD